MVEVRRTGQGARVWTSKTRPTRYRVHARRVPKTNKNCSRKVKSDIFSTRYGHDQVYSKHYHILSLYIACLVLVSLRQFLRGWSSSCRSSFLHVVLSYLSWLFCRVHSVDNLAPFSYRPYSSEYAVGSYFCISLPNV